MCVRDVCPRKEDDLILMTRVLRWAHPQTQETQVKYEEQEAIGEKKNLIFNVLHYSNYNSSCCSAAN